MCLQVLTSPSADSVCCSACSSSSKARQVASQCASRSELRRRPGARLQAAALADFMLPMLVYDPERRATATDMLRHPWLERAAGPRPGASPPAGRSAPGRAGAMEATAAAADRGGGGASDGGGGEAGLQHAGERRRAYSGRSRSRSASPSGARRSRCAAPRTEHGGQAKHMWNRVTHLWQQCSGGQRTISSYLSSVSALQFGARCSLVSRRRLPADASHAGPDV